MLDVALSCPGCLRGRFNGTHPLLESGLSALESETRIRALIGEPANGKGYARQVAGP